MTNITIKTYQENFEDYKAKTPNEVSGDFVDLLDRFLEKIPAGARILELGSAHGRDAKYFRDHGFSVLCTDIIPAALDELIAMGFDARYLDLSEPVPDDLGDFDGIFANAVLHHFDQSTLETVFSDLAKISKPGTCLLYTSDAADDM
jgi:hypothetical protein